VIVELNRKYLLTKKRLRFEEITQSQVQNAREKRKGVSSRGKSFSTEEDKVLCSGWLNISMDAVTGTNL